MPVPPAMRRLFAPMLPAALFVATAASAQAPVAPPAAPPVVSSAPEPTAATPAPNSPYGRYFGHLAYAEAPRSLMAAMIERFAPNKSCEIHRDAAPALYRLIFAAEAAGVTGLRAISCYRPIAYQTALFCGAGLIGACRDPAERARSVAPGGYSEHATGYVVDFGVPSPPGCNDLYPCMAGTPAGAWLIANAPRYGFELSFPAGNAQGVTWEPWHWRWVGVSADEPGARAARAVFARARTRFPARPAIADAPTATRLPPIDPRHFIGPRD